MFSSQNTQTNFVGLSEIIIFSFRGNRAFVNSFILVNGKAAKKHSIFKLIRISCLKKDGLPKVFQETDEWYKFILNIVYNSIRDFLLFP